MEIGTFILGMVTMLLIAAVISGVIAVVKVMKISKNIESLDTWTSQRFENVNNEFEKQKMIIKNQLDDIYRTIDSRNDKLYEKVTKHKPEEADDGFKKTLLQVLNNEDEGNDLKKRILQLMNK